MKSLKNKGDIFTRKKKTAFLGFLRVPKLRWIAGGFAVLFLAFLIIPGFTTSATKVIKAQNVDANHWWNKKDCNGSEASYHCRAQEAYPVEPIENLDPLPTIIPDDPYPAYPSDGITNPGGISQGSSAIAQIQQQIQSQMNSCVQRRQQLFTQLDNQYRQYYKLEAQRDALDDTISRTTDERRVDGLEAQRDRMQQNMDRLDETIAGAQTNLDDAIADCREKINELQARQDELELNLADQFSRFLDYEVPDYDYYRRP